VSRLGTSPPRPDGPAKVSGAARYGDDFSLPGMLWGATLRSPHPHARIRRLAWHPERAPAGAVAVTAADLPGVNGVQLITDDWPILADPFRGPGLVRHVGEPVALAAAPTREAARAALAAFEVDYEPLTPILDLAAAAGEPPMAAIELVRGEVEAGLARAATVVEGTWSTGHQEHIYIECQVMTAWVEDDGTVVVEGSMQCPYFVHRSLCHAFDLPGQKVRILATRVGGGFGGKEDFPSQIALHAALLARAAGGPVRIVYDRHEDIIATTKRHPALIRHRTGVDAEGRLLAMDIEVLLDGGAYPTLSKVVLSRAVLHATGPYRCPNVRIRGRALATHTAPNGAFRGFGAPQSQFAAERQMDRIARRLGLDPLEIRLRNALEPGDTLPTGQVLDGSTAARACLERAAAETRFRERWQALEKERETAADGQRRRGLGLSLYFHGAGFTGNGERTLASQIRARLRDDGRIEVATAAVDMGQGSAILFPMLVAEITGLDEDDVVFAEPDTALVPDSGPTVASRTSMIVGRQAALAARDLSRRVLAWWAREEGGDGRPFRDLARAYLAAGGDGEVCRTHEPPEWQVFDEEHYQGIAYPTYAWAADVVEVEVDPDTLEVHPVHATAVCEVGRVLHETLCRGQVEGGTLQALGWALLEEIKVEDGRYLNDRLATYIIPTFKDSPKIDVVLLEAPWDDGFLGAKGVGELPMDGGAPAALAAIENATGLALGALPATPERLFEALGAARTVRAGEGDSR